MDRGSSTTTTHDMYETPSGRAQLKAALGLKMAIVVWVVTANFSDSGAIEVELECGVLFRHVTPRIVSLSC